MHESQKTQKINLNGKCELLEKYRKKICARVIYFTWNSVYFFHHFMNVDE